MQHLNIKRACQLIITLLVVGQLAGCPLLPPRGAGGPGPVGHNLVGAQQ